MLSDTTKIVCSGLWLNLPLDKGHYISVTYEGDSEALYDAPISFEQLIFTIRLGRYINSVKISAGIDGKEYIGIKQDNGNIIFYKPTIIFECDEQNKTFYSEDGVLYSTETHEKLEFQIEYPE